MEQGKLKSIIRGEIDSSIGFIESETTDQRKQSLEYYLRENYGNEVEGRSAIVTGEVAEAIDGAMPELIRIFTQNEDMVRFEPETAEDEESSKQATDYANFVFYKENNGFLILHNWIKDALLQKNGIIKVYWNTTEDIVKEEYFNLTEDELVLLLGDGRVEVISQETVEEESVDEFGQVQINILHNVKVQRKQSVGKIKIENVPPEEFLISKNARSIEDSPFVAHRRLVTKSELNSMGFDADMIATLPTYDDITFSTERVSRYTNGEQPHESVNLDDAMQTVEVYECYIKTDFDDDGIAELRKVLFAGSEILDNEEIDYVPFHTLCPIPIPHKFFGQSLADRAMDIQLIKSTVIRQMLDNLYLTNNARVGAVEGQVNLDDLLSVTAGGVVRMKSPNAVVPFNIPAVANQAFPMLEYLDSIQSKRTGISDMQQGLDPNILQNVTASAISASAKASAGKLELIARIFAETGIKSMFKCIHQLVCKYQDKPKVIRMRGKYVQMDPRSWKNMYDLSINVGLGTGDRQEKMTMLQLIMSKQEQIIQQYGANNPLVSVTQYRETLGRFIEASGMVDSTDFFKEITPEIEQALAQPQEPQQDQTMNVLMQQAQAQIDVNREKAIADIELKRQKAEADIQLAREKAMAEMQLKREEFEAEAQLKALEVQAGTNRGTEIPS